MLIQSKPANAHNYSSRRGHSIDMLILHTPEASLSSMTSWFQDSDAHASAHYGIGIDGSIVQYVTDDYNAWHAGNGEYNRRSIGIEIEAITTDDKPDFGDVQLDALVWLCTFLIHRYGIPCDRQHIIGHDEVPNPVKPGQFGGINGHTDPGPGFPWERFMMRLGGSVATGIV